MRAQQRPRRVTSAPDDDPTSARPCDGCGHPRNVHNHELPAGCNVDGVVERGVAAMEAAAAAGECPVRACHEAIATAACNCIAYRGITGPAPRERLFGSAVAGWYQRPGRTQRPYYQPAVIYYVRFCCGCERVPGAKTVPCRRHCGGVIAHERELAGRQRAQASGDRA